MPGTFEIRIDDESVRVAVARLVAEGNRQEIPLTWFYQDWKARVLAEWSKITASGGTFRGERWAPMKDQYRRKIDGMRVPAWGDVPKLSGVFYGDENRAIRGRFQYFRGRRLRNNRLFKPVTRNRKGGMVLGKKRPSGKRVKQTSIENMDTGNLKGAILTARPVFTNRIRNRQLALTIGGDLPVYAEHILRGHNRNPLFWKLPEDQQAMERFCIKWLNTLGYNFNQRRGMY
jgi:hypothetical protein